MQILYTISNSLSVSLVPCSLLLMNFFAQSIIENIVTVKPRAIKIAIEIIPL